MTMALEHEFDGRAEPVEAEQRGRAAGADGIGRQLGAAATRVAENLREVWTLPRLDGRLDDPQLDRDLLREASAAPDDR